MSGINLTEAGCTVFVSPYSAFDLLTSKPKTAPPSPPHPVLPPASWSSQNGPVLSVLAFAPSDAPKLPLMFGERPNITGVNAVQHTPSCNGALTSWGEYMGNVVAGDWASGVPIYLNASASSSIYSKSSTVQPSSVCFLPCIKF